VELGKPLVLADRTKQVDTVAYHERAAQTCILFLGAAGHETK
jgi:hypothetical protein